MDSETDFGKRRIVVALECVEVVGTHLGGAVSAPQVVFKENRHFPNHRLARHVDGGGYLEGGNEVFLAVGPDLADGQLRAGDDDRLVEVAEHEGERRGCIGHRVGAVEHDKSVIFLIVMLDGARNLLPSPLVHVAGVNGGMELDVVDVIVEHLDLGDVVDQMAEVKRL